MATAREHLHIRAVLKARDVPRCRKRRNLCLSQLRLFSEKTGRASKDRKPVEKMRRSLDARGPSNVGCLQSDIRNKGSVRHQSRGMCI